MSAMAGAEAGAAIGSFVGPEGTVVGAVVGGLIGLGIGIYAAQKISEANSQADSELKDTPQDEVCADCGEVGCFNTPEGGDPDEMDRQLKEQQDAINKKSPDEILDRLNKFAEEGRPNDSAERNAARAQARNDAAKEAYTQARAAGKSRAEAEAAAQQAGDAALAGKDATHELDWVAGGDGKLSGLGDSKTNRSIGSQWTHKTPGSSTTRVEDLRNAAEAAKKAGKKTMDVELKRC